MSPSSPTGGPPLRAVAMVLIALAITFGGLGAFSLSGSSSTSSSSGSSSTTSTSSTPAASTVSGSASSVAPPPPAPKPTAAAPTTTAAAATTTETQTTETTAAPAPSGAVDKSQAVHVLNNSMVHGLANTYAGKLRADGWTNLSTGNYPSANAQLAQTTVYYGDAPGEQAAAQSIATLLGATTVPKSQGVALPTTGVVVVVTSG